MIGYDPVVENMVIVDDQDFSHFFGVNDDDPFPGGTTLTLNIYSRDAETQLGTWPAISVTASGAQVQINSEDLTDVPDGAAFRVYVDYPTTERLCWYRGRVWRRT